MGKMKCSVFRLGQGQGLQALPGTVLCSGAGVCALYYGEQQTVNIFRCRRIGEIRMPNKWSPLS